MSVRGALFECRGAECRRAPGRGCGQPRCSPDRCRRGSAARAPRGARPLAPPPKLLAQVRGLVAAHSRLLAMKGRWPEKELEALPPSWRLVGSRELTVPRLGEARCVLVLALAVD